MNVLLHVFVCLCYMCLCWYVCVSHCALTSSKKADWIRLARITDNSQSGTEFLQRTDHSFTWLSLPELVEDTPNAKPNTSAANYLGLLIKCFVNKMPPRILTNAHHFAEHKVTSSNHCFYLNNRPKPKDIQFTMIENRDKQQILTS